MIRTFDRRVRRLGVIVRSGRGVVELRGNPGSQLVFILCFTSFAVVLTLGGGPAASTVEVAIYQSLRFELDPARAVFLALLELGCCALLVAACTLFVALPLAAVVVAGLAGPVGKVLSDGLFWACAARSFVIVLCAAPLALVLAWSLLAMCRRLRLRHARPGWADGVELSGSLIIVVPPIVFGTGFFILLSPHMDVYTVGPPLVVLVNTLMGVPYVLRVLGPLHRQMSARYEHLCENLGLRSMSRLRLVEVPLLRRPLGLALGLCAAISVGDLGVIALFLILLCLGLFATLERAVGGRARC